MTDAETRRQAILHGQMVCEIINPSDPYTLRTDDFLVAAVAIAVLGRGQLGLVSLDEEHQTPILFGWTEWLESYGVTDLGEYVQEHAIEIADVLDSVLIGKPASRQDVEDVILLIKPGWLAKRHDRIRSSMNDIGRAAWELAGRLRAKHDGKTEEQHQ